MESGSPGVEHQRDVVYGYKDGMGLLMNVFAPQERANGVGIIFVVSSGMNSDPEWSRGFGDTVTTKELLESGYTVFAVGHSSQPKYTADEIGQDLQRAVRFIRYNATRFGIDPEHIGIMGASSGGGLCLLTATLSLPPDPEAEDPVNRESSRVQAAVAYFSGTDFLNFGREGTTIFQHFNAQGVKNDATWDFHRWDDETNLLERIEDEDLRREIFRENSPITHISVETPPVLLFHGDQDQLVPLQQSEIFVTRLKEVGVPHKLIIAEGREHGLSRWKPPLEGEYEEILGWFKRYLLVQH